MRLSIGGKDFDLKPLTLNDWIKAEDMGLDVSRLQKQDVKFKDLRTLAFVAVNKVDADVTLEWVGENICLEDMEVLVQLTNFIKPKAAAADANT